MATTTTNTTTINTTSNSTSTSDVQKFKSLTEKLRLEISELRAELQAEKCAVRELKVLNDKNLRKHKLELQSREQSFKRQLSETAQNNRSQNDSAKRQRKNTDNTNGDSSDFCENCRKLMNENKTLKQTNKELEERLQNLLEADRLKAADLRAQHENHLIELQRIQRSTRIETQRLLEELKTKDHLIDQLKRRPLQPLQQNRIQHNGKINATNNKSTQTTELMRKLINGRDPTTIDHNLDDTTKQQSNQVVIESITNKQCSNDIEHNNNNKIDVLIKQACCYQPTMITTANETETIIKSPHEMPPALKERLSVGHLIVDDKHEQQQQQLFTINNNQKQYLKEDNITNDTTPQSQINKHRKELYYRPLVDIERAIVEEDTDSAVSSAPSSLSPQPYHHVSSSSNSPIHHQYNNTTQPTIQQHQQQQQQQSTTTITAADLWYRHNNGIIVDQQQQSINDINKNVIIDGTVVQQCTLEKGELQTELAIAKCQVRELERALLVTREIKNNNQNNNTNHLNSTSNNNDNNTINLLKERIRCLEAHEQQLLRQLQQLREQNELQEFRILELEECHEKWSLRSQSSSELRDIETSRVVTPITNETTDCNSLMNENDNMSSEHDLIREHLLVMLNKTQDPDDRHCLQQVTTLLDNLETLSQEHSNCCGVDDDDHVDDVDDHFNIHIHHDDAIINNSYYSDTTQSTPLHQHAPTKHQDIDNNEFTKHLILKKKQLSQASSLQESGIFEADDVISVQTQTDLQDLTIPNKTDIRLSELTAEIQKLNKIRASIEENGKKPNHQTHSLPIHKELEFYKNRLEMLENKINIYESSGDMQMKRLKERLNHEIVLTTQVTDLQSKLNKLEQENRRLEEEKCEFEEAENDTRLQYQQLEIELKMTQEYLHDLEEARNAVKRKLKEAKQNTQYWEQMFTRCEARNYELEEYQLELQCKHDFLVQILPVLILYSLWYYHQNQRSIEGPTKSLNTNNKIVTCGNNKKMVELMDNNKELRKQIEIYKQREEAYIETLQQADNIWAEMETEYKRRIQVIEDNEIQLKTQIKQLEDNDLVQRKNIQEFNERILELEDTERRQFEQIKYLENEKKFLLKENSCIKDELTNAKNEWHHIKDNLEGACHVEMERLRKKIRTLQDDLDISTKVIEDTEESYQKEISILKIQLQKLNKELLHLDITNSELRELITQLETRISELQTNLLEQRLQSDRTIKNLTSELMSQRENTQSLFRKRSFNSFDQHLSLLTQSTSTSNLSSSASQNNVLSLRDELQKSDSNLNDTLH